MFGWRFGEQARHGVALAAVDELGAGRFGALVGGLPTASAELAARRRVDRIRGFAAEDDPLSI